MEQLGIYIGGVITGVGIGLLIAPWYRSLGGEER
jgi:hypothetical protein